MKISTATGRKYECDLAVENPSPPRLYLNLIEADAEEAAAVFADAKELPIAGYPAYTVFNSLSVSSNGVRVTLKKEEP